MIISNKIKAVGLAALVTILSDDANAQEKWTDEKNLIDPGIDLPNTFEVRQSSDGKYRVKLKQDSITVNTAEYPKAKLKSQYNLKNNEAVFLFVDSDDFDDKGNPLVQKLSNINEPIRDEIGRGPYRGYVVVPSDSNYFLVGMRVNKKPYQPDGRLQSPQDVAVEESPKSGSGAEGGKKRRRERAAKPVTRGMEKNSSSRQAQGPGQPSSAESKQSLEFQGQSGTYIVSGRREKRIDLQQQTLLFSFDSDIISKKTKFNASNSGDVDAESLTLDFRTGVGFNLGKFLFGGMIGAEYNNIEARDPIKNISLGRRTDALSILPGALFKYNNNLGLILAYRLNKTVLDYHNVTIAGVEKGFIGRGTIELPLVNSKSIDTNFKLTADLAFLDVQQQVTGNEGSNFTNNYGDQTNFYLSPALEFLLKNHGTNLSLGLDLTSIYDPSLRSNLSPEQLTRLSEVGSRNVNGLNASNINGFGGLLRISKETPFGQFYGNLNFPLLGNLKNFEIGGGLKNPNIAFYLTYNYNSVNAASYNLSNQATFLIGNTNGNNSLNDLLDVGKPFRNLR